MVRETEAPLSQPPIALVRFIEASAIVSYGRPSHRSPQSNPQMMGPTVVGPRHAQWPLHDHGVV
jgi:hypothetical protein